MIPLLGMLQGIGGGMGAMGGMSQAGQIGQAAGAQAGGTGGRFGQAVMQRGFGQAGPSDKKIGMQYANMGLQAPELPNMMNMISGLQQMTQPQIQGRSRNLPTFSVLNMLRGGQ